MSIKLFDVTEIMSTDSIIELQCYCL